jgi:hypothetical protein
MTRCSSSFAEALIFPCKFKLCESGKLIQLENHFQNVIDVERVPRKDHNKASEKTLGLALPPSSKSSRHRGVSAITLTEFDSDISNCLGDAKSLTRILLEFKCENLFKYQVILLFLSFFNY